MSSHPYISARALPPNGRRPARKGKAGLARTAGCPRYKTGQQGDRTRRRQAGQILWGWAGPGLAGLGWGVGR